MNREAPDYFASSTSASIPPADREMYREQGILSELSGPHVV